MGTTTRYLSSAGKEDAKKKNLGDVIRMAGEGPPPPGVVTLASVPRALRQYGKVLKVKGVVFDYGVMTRALELEEAAAGTHQISGFDPRHARFQGFDADAAPVHGAAKWLASLDDAGVAAASVARGVSVATGGAAEEGCDGGGGGDPIGSDAVRKKLEESGAELESLTVPVLKERCREQGLPWSGVKHELVARLLAERKEAALAKGRGDGSGAGVTRRAALVAAVKAVNKSWVDEQLAREARKQLKDMGLEHTGKPWQVSARLEQALWDGDGKAPKFRLKKADDNDGGAAAAAGSGGGKPGGVKDDAASLEAAADLAKMLGVDVKLGSETLKDGRLGISLEGGGGGSGRDGLRVRKGEDELALLQSLDAEAFGGAAKERGPNNGSSSEKKKEKVFVDSTPKGLPKELADIKTKYQAKLLAKTGGMVASRKLDVVKGDAEALSWGRALLQEKEAQAAEPAFNQRWLLGNGVGGLLEYLERRSMRTCLLPDERTPLAELELFEQQLPSAIKGLVLVEPSQVAARFGNKPGAAGGVGPEGGGGGSGGSGGSGAKEEAAKANPSFGIFSFLFGGSGGKGLGKGKGRAPASADDKAKAVAAWRQCLTDAAQRMEMDDGDFRQLLVISDRNELLRAARDLSCHTVAFNPPNQRRVDAATDDAVPAIADLKHTIDALNGISYRS